MWGQQGPDTWGAQPGGESRRSAFLGEWRSGGGAARERCHRWLYGRCSTWRGIAISILRSWRDAKPVPPCAVVVCGFLTSLGVQALSAAACEKGGKPLYRP